MKVKIREYQNRYEVITSAGGFTAEKPITLQHVKQQAILWVKGLETPEPEKPIHEEEFTME